MTLSPLGIVAAIAALLGLLLLWSAVLRLRRRRVIAAGRNGLGALLLLAIGGGLAAVSMNVYTYSRLAFERPVAELAFARIGPQHYAVHLALADGSEQELELRGDEWQIDARILKWKGVATLLGLDARYRLERIAGRYEELERERNDVRTVHGLNDNPGLDLWQLARRHQRWLPWVDASYGSATYLPMADGAVFDVKLTQSGLVARPRNPIAEKAVAEWQ